MKHTKKLLLLTVMAVATTLTAAASDSNDEVTSVWNEKNVLLPASQFTPARTWKAQTMVFNTGRSYADADYNRVFGTPPADADGRPWYAADYVPTNGEKTWQEHTSPFSTDEYYLGQRSYQWIGVGIMGDIYLRRSFTLDQPIERTVFLACGHDDAPAEYYLNGELVFTATDGWENDKRVLLTDGQKALIKTDGTENVLAVHVHQNWGGAFADCGLYEADMKRSVKLLRTLDDGPWPCAYYLLNSNDELNSIPLSEWAGRCADETDWAFADGPFSNSQDKFLTTHWGSERLPLLVRRHFTLTAEDLGKIAESTLELTCSYDENPKIYLNGTLIWQREGWNDNNYSSTTLTATQKRLLVEGDNVLAVSLTAGEGGGHLDLGLALTQPYDPTGINTIAAENHPSATPSIYDLSGRRVGNCMAALHRGIYIVNGKKIIVK